MAVGTQTTLLGTIIARIICLHTTTGLSAFSQRYHCLVRRKSGSLTKEIVLKYPERDKFDLFSKLDMLASSGLEILILCTPETKAKDDKGIFRDLVLVHQVNMKDSAGAIVDVGALDLKHLTKYIRGTQGATTP